MEPGKRFNLDRISHLTPQEVQAGALFFDERLKSVDDEIDRKQKNEEIKPKKSKNKIDSKRKDKKTPVSYFAKYPSKNEDNGIIPISIDTSTGLSTCFDRSIPICNDFVVAKSCLAYPLGIGNTNPSHIRVQFFGLLPRLYLGLRALPQMSD